MLRLITQPSQKTEHLQESDTSNAVDLRKKTMNHLYQDTLQVIGDTSLVTFRKIRAASGARILLKPIHIVTSDAFVQEKLDHTEVLGATIATVMCDSGIKYLSTLDFRSHTS